MLTIQYACERFSGQEQNIFIVTKLILIMNQNQKNKY